MFYYRGTEVFAVRLGAYKAHFITQSEYGGEEPVAHDPPLLYDLNTDPSEKYDIAEQHPEIISQIKDLLIEHKKSVIPVENQLEKRTGE